MLIHLTIIIPPCFAKGIPCPDTADQQQKGILRACFSTLFLLQQKEVKTGKRHAKINRNAEKV